MNSDSPRRGGFRISEWGIRNPVPVAVLFIGAVIAGLISYTALPIKNFPTANKNAVTVAPIQTSRQAILWRGMYL